MESQVWATAMGVDATQIKVKALSGYVTTTLENHSAVSRTNRQTETLPSNTHTHTQTDKQTNKQTFDRLR